MSSAAPRPRRGSTTAPNVATKVHRSSTPTATRRASCARRRRCRTCSRWKARWTSSRCKLDMDPIELRRINDTMKEPITGAPYTQPLADGVLRRGRGGLRLGETQSAAGIDARRRLADRLGLRHRLLSDPDGAGRRAGPLQRDGKVRVEIAAHEIGNGAYTVIAQRRPRGSACRSKRSRSSSATAICRPRRSPAARSQHVPADVLGGQDRQRLQGVDAETKPD